MYVRCGAWGGLADDCVNLSRRGCAGLLRTIGAEYPHLRTDRSWTIGAGTRSWPRRKKTRPPGDNERVWRACNDPVASSERRTNAVIIKVERYAPADPYLGDSVNDVAGRVSPLVSTRPDRSRLRSVRPASTLPDVPIARSLPQLRGTPSCPAKHGFLLLAVGPRRH